jgi:hypothetical protein
MDTSIQKTPKLKEGLSSLFLTILNVGVASWNMFKQNDIFPLFIILALASLGCFIYQTRPKLKTKIIYLCVFVLVVVLGLFTSQLFHYYQNPIEVAYIPPPNSQPQKVKIPWWCPPLATVNKINNEGVDSLSLGNHDAAIAKFQEGIKRNPRLSYLRNNLGLALSRNVQSELQLNNATAVFESAIGLRENDPVPYENLILLLSGHSQRSSKIRGLCHEALKPKCESREKWRDWLLETQRENQ